MELCIQDEAAFLSNNNTLRQHSLQRARELGASYIRKVVWLHYLDPCNTEYAQWQTLYETLIQEATAAGLKVQLVFSGVADPTWGKPCPTKPPSGLAPSIPNWQAFLQQWLPHFYQLGVRRFSLWNEPNNQDFLRTSGSNSAAALGKYYRKIAVAGLATIAALQKSRAVGPDIQVLLGEMADMDFTFMNALFNGPKLVADGFSFHPYQFCQNPATDKFLGAAAPKCKSHMPGISAIGPTQTQLKELHIKGKFATRKRGIVPLYLTEFGYMRTSGNAIPETVRAKWYPLALTAALKHGAKGMNLYQLYPSPPGTWDTSLLEASGSPSPSYTAVWNWAEKHGYATEPIAD